ncbi:f-box/lrr-repeat protein [Fagus crenata]
MKSKSKRQKISYQVEYEDSVSSRRHNILKKDRISNLPYNVLIHILSFLPTKHAVGTSILSTKWKNLWTSVPNLDFEDDLLLQGRRPGNESIGDLRVSFLSFVDRVLILHNAPNIHRFRLKCGQNFKSSHVNAWIYAALLRYAQELDLCVPMKNYKSLHCDLFRSKSLVYLKLGTKFVLNVPAFVRLPCLRTLHLNSIEFLDDHSTHKLISSCPVLEKLFIEECGMKNIRCFNISAPALKCLIMECAIIDEYNTELCEYKIVIDAPNLEYLRLYDYVAEGYHLKNLNSLTEAQVHVDLSTRKLEQMGHAYYGQQVLELIKGIHNVKVLHLTGDSMEALKLSSCDLPTLHNVSHLEIDVNKNIGWQLLPDLLKSVPNLQALYFGMVSLPGNASIKDLRVTFSSFVDRVLNLNNAPHIHRVRVKCGQNYKPSHVNAWIDSALWRNVQELDLCVPMRNYKSLHCGLFTSKSLVYLKLGTNFVLSVPAFVLLPSLRTLHLNSIEFSDDDSTHKLFSSCPVLEELFIVECGMKNICCFNISAPVLKRLTMEFTIEGEYNTEFCEYKIIIDTPTLEYFRLHDYVAEGYDLKNLKSLTEAEVHVDLSTQKLEQMSHAYYGQAVLKLIKGICSVKVLHLTGDSMEALKSSGCDLPMLHNVSHLKLNVNKHIGWQLLPDLLKSLPNLLALYFPMGLVHKWGGDCQWHPPEWVPCCLLFRLKRISIWEFQGQKGEFKMVKYLLQNARVLRMFSIRTNHLTKEEELKITKELLLLPRGSVTCQVVCS